MRSGELEDRRSSPLYFLRCPTVRVCLASHGIVRREADVSSGLGWVSLKIVSPPACHPGGGSFSSAFSSSNVEALFGSCHSTTVAAVPSLAAEFLEGSSGC
ncbi:unnamed protein product [Linum trigynum]|uniref:Uncharacterized protein n=1 Tax=Linum trigynum TaxID=586398 RepID=A0AAV2FJC9_9ROSI